MLAPLAVAAMLRLPVLDRAPAGLNVDEASNAWNTWCLLHTGRDQHGVGWPILESTGYGQGSTTLLLYLALPFQAGAGLTPLAIRMPGVVCGLLAILLTYVAASSLFDRRIGFASAVFVAIAPGHVQLSRWGHQAVVFPLLTAFMMMVFATSQEHDADGSQGKSRLAWSVVAGMLAGVAMYGYYAIRLWLPLLIGCMGVALWRQLRAHLRETMAFAIAFGLVAAPLVLGTLTRADLRKRATVTWVWSRDDPPARRAAKVAARYLPHFGPDYLVRRGDPDPALSPPDGYGILPRFMLPLLIAGVMVLLRGLRRSRAARILVVMLALYPAADLLSEHPTSHSLRSAPGVIILPVVAAVGLFAFYDWIRNRNILGANLLMLGVAVWALSSTLSYAGALFDRMDLERRKFYAYEVDMVQAVKWLTPRLDHVDAAFVTGSISAHPYMYTLVGLRYSPQQWFRDEKRFEMGPLPNGAYKFEEVCFRYGKLNFFFGDAGLDTLNALRWNGRRDHVLVIRRPGELADLPLPRPSMTISEPDGSPVMELIEADI